MIDELERLIQIQKLNDYFESKKIIKYYNPDKLRRTRILKKDMTEHEWTIYKKQKYSKEYYELNKEKLKAYQKAKYYAKKAHLNSKLT